MMFEGRKHVANNHTVTDKVSRRSTNTNAWFASGRTDLRETPPMVRGHTACNIKHSGSLAKENTS